MNIIMCEACLNYIYQYLLNTFPVIIDIKNKYQNKLNIDPYL